MTLDASEVLPEEEGKRGEEEEAGSSTELQVRGRELAHHSPPSTCQCCAVVLHKKPGRDCRIVPMWELKDWVCQDCNPPVYASSLCNRVVYNFRRAIVSNVKPSRWRYFNENAQAYEHRYFLPGAGSYPYTSNTRGVLMGFYRDTACEIKPSPHNFIGQSTSNTAIYTLQLDPWPPPSSPKPPPAEDTWGQCCDRYNCLSAGVDASCGGCRVCSKLGDAAVGLSLGESHCQSPTTRACLKASPPPPQLLPAPPSTHLPHLLHACLAGCTAGVKCRELCNRFYTNWNGETCVWDGSDCTGQALSSSMSECSAAPPMPVIATAASPPPPSPSPFSEHYCPGGAYRCCVVLYMLSPRCTSVPVWDFSYFNKAACGGASRPMVPHTCEPAESQNSALRPQEPSTLAQSATRSKPFGADQVQGTIRRTCRCRRYVARSACQTTGQELARAIRVLYRPHQALHCLRPVPGSCTPPPQPSRHVKTSLLG